MKYYKIRIRKDSGVPLHTHFLKAESIDAAKNEFARRRKRTFWEIDSIVEARHPRKIPLMMLGCGLALCVAGPLLHSRYATGKFGDTFDRFVVISVVGVIVSLASYISALEINPKEKYYFTPALQAPPSQRVQDLLTLLKIYDNWVIKISPLVIAAIIFALVRGCKSGLFH